MPDLAQLQGVSGLGTALPDTVVTTEALALRLGVAPEWILSRTGIAERRAVAPGERLHDLAVAAAAAALDDAGVTAAELDLVLVATCSPDQLLAPVAAQVASALGASCGAIDLSAACTGFVSGLALAAGALESGRARCVLLVGAEVLSRLTDPGDRRTAALFGDGAGAMVLTSTARISRVVMGSDGEHAALLQIRREAGTIEMDGPAVFAHAVERMAQVADELDDGDIDLYVFHQANARILKAITRRLDLDESRVVNAIARHGNTSAASIPLALAEARAQGRLRSGDRVLVAAFGAGFTWGGTVITW